MDLDKWIQNRGMREVRNPNYNKGKNGEPEFVMVPDVAPHTTPLINMALEHGRNYYSVDAKEVEKYNRYGINWSPYVENIDAQLADAQSGWSKMANALGQTLWSEIALGTLKGFTDLADFVSSNILHLTEKDYQNPASETIQQWQDYYNNEVAPIYTNPDTNIQNGGLTDIGWYAKNIPSIASSLTLFIPGAGVTKGLSALANASVKGMSIARAAGKTRRWLSFVKKGTPAEQMSKWGRALNNPINVARANAAVEMTTNALLMRTMENYQEARDVHTQTYQNALDKLSRMNDEEYAEWINSNKLLIGDSNPNSKDDVAKTIAKKAADRTFAMDYSNLIFDVIQLYGLKEFGKGVKSIVRPNATLRATERQALADAEALAKGVATEPIKRTALYRTKEYIKDVGSSFGKSFLEESTEGIEEGVNYIAQQEGLTYGKMLLDGRQDDYKVEGFGRYASLGLGDVINTWRHLQNPLNEYLESAELQESAFWGVIGGLAFGGAASGLTRLGEGIKNKKQKKADAKQKEKTGETTNATDEGGTNWNSIFELPQEKAARIAIQNRIVRLNALQQMLSDIKDGKDIFHPNSDGSYNAFTGTKEEINAKKEMAIAKLENQFISDIAMEAMASGTYDSLLEYFSNEKIRDAMVKIGMISEEDKNTRIEEIKKRLENTRELYEAHAAALYNQAAYLNATGKKDIPLEYLQIIAKNNTDRHLDLNDVREQISTLENIIAKEEANLSDEDKSVYRDASRIQALATFYTYLEGEENALESEKESLPPFEYERRKQNIRERKKSIIKQLSEINFINTLGEHTSFSPISNIFHAISKANGMIGLGEVDEASGYHTTYAKGAFAKTDEELIKDLQSLMSDVFGNKGIFNADDVVDNKDRIIQETKQIRQQISDLLEGEDGLANKNATLFSYYQQLSGMQLDEAIRDSFIIRTSGQISNYVDYLHNSMNKARKDMLEKATDEVVSLFRKYYDKDEVNNFQRSIIAAYKQDKREARKLAESFMSKEDADNLMNYLDIFNFGNTSNDAVFTYLRTLLDNEDAIIRRERTQVSPSEETSSENQNGETENGETSSDASDSTQNQPTINPSSQPQNAPTEGERGQNQPVSIQRTQQINVHLYFDTEGNLVTISNSNHDVGTIVESSVEQNIPAYILSDGNIEIDVKSVQDDSRRLRLVRSHLFSTDINLIDSSWDVVTNPIIEGGSTTIVNPKIIKQGTVVDTNTTPIEENGQLNPPAPVPITDEEDGVETDDFKMDGAISEGTELGGTIYNEGEHETVTPIPSTGDATETREKTTREKQLESALNAEYWMFSDEEEGTTYIVKYENGRVTFKNKYANDEDAGNDVGVDTFDETATYGTLARERGIEAVIKHFRPNATNIQKVTYREWGYKPETLRELQRLEVGMPSNTLNETLSEELDVLVSKAFEERIPKNDAGLPDFVNMDVDAIASKVMNALQTLGNQAKYGDNLAYFISEKTDQMKGLQETIKEFNSNLGQDAAALAFQSKVEEGRGSEVTPLYKVIVDNFMKEYTRITQLPVVDGKQVIRLEDVLRVCHNIYGSIDTKAAQSVYDVLTLYLDSKEGKQKYSVIDKTESQNAISRLNRTNKEILGEWNGIDLISERIDLSDTSLRLEQTPEDDDARAKQELLRRTINGLKKGDKVLFSYVPSTKEFVISKDGVPIGTMSTPYLTPDGHLGQINSGWVTEIDLDANGRPRSVLKDKLDYIFTSDDDVAKQLRTLITRVLIGDIDNITPDVIRDFSSNPIIEAMYKETRLFVDTNGAQGYQWFYINYKDRKTVDYDRLIKHLARLYKYNTTINDITDKESYNKTIRDSLDSWFEKLYRSYNALFNLSEFEDFFTNPIEVEISKIQQPPTVKIIETTGGVINNYNALSYSNQGIANPESAKVGIATDRESVSLSNGEQVPTRGIHKGSTFVVLDNDDNQANFVQTVGTQCKDLLQSGNLPIDSPQGKILQSILSTIEAEVANLVATPTNANMIQLYNVLQKIFYNYGNKEKKVIPLLAVNSENEKLYIDFSGRDVNNQALHIKHQSGVKYKELFIYPNANNANNFTIKIVDFDGSVTTTNRYYVGQTVSGSVVTNARMAENISKIIKKIAFNHCSFFISQKGILNDSQKDEDYDGYVRYENGKCVIDIPGAEAVIDAQGVKRYDRRDSNKNHHKVEVDNYGQWLIQNGLLKVNTKIGANRQNHQSRTENQLLNQNIYVGIPSPKDVEKAVRQSQEEHPVHVDASSDRQLFELLVGIANSESENKGIELMEAMLGRNKVEELRRLCEDLATDGIDFNIFDLLPRRLNYDKDINYYAENGEVYGAIAYSSGDLKDPKYAIYNAQGERLPGARKLGTRNRADVVVGAWWMNMASGAGVTVGRRNAAIRKLIHENLHNKLAQNPEAKKVLFDKLQDILTAFKTRLAEDIRKNPNDGTLKNIYKAIKNYKDDRLTEEFLIESLTNSEFYNYLNSIESDEKINDKPKSLLNLILEAIAKFFGWTPVQDYTLMAKEMNVLKEWTDILKTDNTETDNRNNSSEGEIQQTPQQPIVQEPVQEPTPQPKPEQPSQQPSQQEGEKPARTRGRRRVIDDDASYEASVEEDTFRPVEIYSSNDVMRTKNLDAFANHLPLDLQDKFNDAKNNGIINIKCR